jgi:lipopolysaccharide export system protein LptC
MTRDLASMATENTSPDNRRAIDMAANDALAAAQRRRPGTSYSRFVALMKLVLPVIAGILIMLVVLWPELTDHPSKFQIGVAQIEFDGADGQKLVNARYTGVDRENNPFSVTAEMLAQNPDDEDAVDLKNPKADITVSGGSWLAIMSPNGLYRKKKQVLELYGGVNAFHDMGYEFRTEHAFVNFQDGSAFGESPVHGQGPTGELQSEGFRVFESGANIVFTGRARLLLYPTNKGGAK